MGILLYAMKLLKNDRPQQTKRLFKLMFSVTVSPSRGPKTVYKDSGLLWGPMGSLLLTHCIASQ